MLILGQQIIEFSRNGMSFFTYLIYNVINFNILFYSETVTNADFYLSVAYWRFWLCVSVVYELFLIFILFQVGAELSSFIR